MRKHRTKAVVKVFPPGRSEAYDGTCTCGYKARGVSRPDVTTLLARHIKESS